MRSKTPRTLSRNQRGPHPLGLRIPTRGVRHTHRPDLEKTANPAGRREFSAFVIGVTSSGLEGGYKVCEVPFLAGQEPKMKSWIAGALITCLTVVVVVGAATRQSRSLAPIPVRPTTVRPCATPCKLGLEGIVSKRLGSPYRPGRSRHWVKSKNPKHPAVKREAEEE
jgi:hypothetical protein